MTATEPRFFTTSILPVRERLVLRHGRSVKLPLRARVGYFHHPKLGHVLIDTGYGPALWRRQGLALAAYRALLRPSILNEAPLAAGLGRLGLTPADIQTVVLTHFHADHIAGLADLPQARLLCPRPGWDALQRQGRLRNAAEGVFPALLPEGAQGRMGFVQDSPVVEAPTGLGPACDIAGDGSVLVIDLPGHLSGHFGLFWPSLARPLLYATDVQWTVKAIVADRPPGFPASRSYHNRTEAMASLAKVRRFMATGGDVVLCHDPHVHRLDLDPEVGG